MCGTKGHAGCWVFDQLPLDKLNQQLAAPCAAVSHQASNCQQCQTACMNNQLPAATIPGAPKAAVRALVPLNMLLTTKHCQDGCLLA